MGSSNWTNEDIQIVKDTLNEISETLLEIKDKLKTSRLEE